MRDVDLRSPKVALALVASIIACAQLESQSKPSTLSPIGLTTASPSEKLANHDTIRKVVAEARIDITKSRLLCYLAAVQADDHGFKAAKSYIAMTKFDAPRMCLQIIDEAIQVHGAHGVSQDSRLTDLYIGTRILRVADGPDIVHLNTIAKEELKKKTSVMGAMVSGKNKNIEKYGKFDHVTPRIGSRL